MSEKFFLRKIYISTNICNFLGTFCSDSFLFLGKSIFIFFSKQILTLLIVNFYESNLIKEKKIS